MFFEMVIETSCVVSTMKTTYIACLYCNISMSYYPYDGVTNDFGV